MTALGRAMVVAILAAAVASPGTASASWHANGGNGSGHSSAKTLAAGNTPTVSVSNRSVAVSWSASGGAVPVSGYLVRRYDLGNQLQSVGANCAGTVSGLACTENQVPAGSWQYTVTPVNGNWRGAESAKSATATVAAPALSLTPSTINAVPATVTGQIQHYIDGQTVSFRLDNPTTGTLLSGSITPSPVPSNGTAAVSVTIPAGTTDGSHTVYAVGSLGDVASAPLTVDTSCSAPGDQVVSASRDSYVDSLQTNTNFGNSSQLLVRSAQVLVLSRQEAVVGFNLPSIPARCTLTAATLRMYATNPASGRTIDVLRLNGSWTETGVTWNNLPATTGAAVSSASLGSAGFQSWNVLSMTAAMYSGTNDGFLIKDSVDSAVLSVQQVYQSRNGTPDSQDPQLVLTFG